MENFEDLLSKIPYSILDNELYFNIKPLIEEAAKINFEQVSKVLLSYFKVISEKIPIFDVYKSLNVNIEMELCLSLSCNSKSQSGFGKANP